MTFERAVREIPARRWVGLTATPYRRDGLQALMAMHCGPVRHTMTALGAALRTLDLIVHETDHQTAEDGHTFRRSFVAWSKTAGAPQRSATTSPPLRVRVGTASCSPAGPNTSTPSPRCSPPLCSVKASTARRSTPCSWLSQSSSKAVSSSTSAGSCDPPTPRPTVEVHDYVDALVPVLARMHRERRTAYSTLGFKLPRPL